MNRSFSLLMLTLILVLVAAGTANGQSPFIREGPACFDTTQPPTTTPTFQKTYGGVGEESLSGAIVAPDGGYIATGYSKSCTSGDANICVIKTDSTGTLQWAKDYGNTGNDYGSTTIPIEDGFMIVGTTQITGKGYEILVIRTDLQGNVVWEKTYGGTSDDHGNTMIRTLSGEFLVAGTTYSFGAGIADAYLMKIDVNGNVRWFKAYGTNRTDLISTILEESDGSIIMTGTHYFLGHDMLLMKADSSGNLLWAQRYPMSSSQESGAGLAKAANGDYLVVAEAYYTSSLSDALIYSIDPYGVLIWVKTYNSPVSGRTICVARSVLGLSDGGIVVGGRWAGSSADANFSGFLMKTDNSGSVQWCREYSGSSTQFYWGMRQTNDGGFIVGGQTNKSGAGGYDCYLVRTDSSGMVDSSIPSVQPVVGNPSLYTSSVTLSTTVVIPYPMFVLDKSSLNFGDVPIGGSATQSVKITNTGMMNALIISNVTSIPGYTITPNPPAAYPITIACSASRNFDVTFTPTSINSYSGNIMFEHNAEGDTTNLFVTGNGIYPPVISITPDSLSVDLPPGQTTTRTITISNSGLGNLSFYASLGFSGSSSVNTSSASKAVASSSYRGAIQAGAEYEPDQVIVKFKETSSPSRVMSMRSNLKAKVAKKFKKFRAEVWKLSGISVADAIELYKDDPDIEFIEPDYIRYTLDRIPNDPLFSQLWGMQKISAPAAWDMTTGTNIIIGDIDTGIDPTHVDLSANLWTNPGEIAGNGIDDDLNGYIDDIHGWDFYNNDNDPYDDHSHGTHTAGTIAAMGNNGVGVAGVCWSAKIMVLKFLGAGGGGSTSGAISAIEYATMMHAKLTSNSWGGGGYSQALYDAIKAAGDAGILFVAAAGNDARNTDITANYPSCYDLDNIISVASTTSDDGLSYFSNYGPVTVDLGAPGSNVLSTIPGNGYSTKNGTSMATPHVSGVAGLVLSLNSMLNYSEVKNIILSSVDPIPSLAGMTVTGGRLNAVRALESTQTWLTFSPLSDTLSPGTSIDLTVTFDATDVEIGDYRSAIIISSNDPVNNRKDIPISMHVMGIPAISVTPDTVKADTVYVGIPHVNIVKVKNIGTDVLHVTNITSSLPVFTPNRTTFSVSPGGEQSIAVRFTPTDTITYNGVMTIMSNDPLHPTVEVLLEGQGIYFNIILDASWNLISVPFRQTNDSAQVIFPGKYGEMTRYDQVLGDYVEAPILELGLGYWIYYMNPDTITITGTVADTITIACKTGWNLIGSREREVQVSDLQLSTGSLFGSAFYYNTGIGDYVETSVISPGQGVWVYVTSDCELTIP